MIRTSLPRLLLATSNPGKLEELLDLLQGFPFPIVTPDELGLALNVPEDGLDYASNARFKAVAFSKASGLWSLADDTGLEVDALGGAPGLHSRRLAASDPERRRRLLDLLSTFPRPWTATFRSSVALADPAGPSYTADGSCTGEILAAPRGLHGFGYDPLFRVTGTERTLAEMTLEEKNRLSHRARAVRALLPEIRARLGGPP